MAHQTQEGMALPMPHRLLTRWGVPGVLTKPLCFAFHFASPVAFGMGGGIATVEVGQWQHPYAAFILASAVIQLFIALLRAWFGERRELVSTLTAQIDRQEARFVRRIEEDAIIRHEQANQLQRQAWIIHCTQSGLPMDNPPKPMYDVEKERDLLRSGEDLHMTRAV
jgi:hypothetical protein